MKPRLWLVFALLVSQAFSLTGGVTARDAAQTAGPAALTLGQPGLSFRYAQTFGVTKVPYLADSSHLYWPHSVWVDNAGNLYVTEPDGHRLLKYNSTGVFQFSVGTAGSLGGGEYEFDHPLKVTVDSSSNIFVADTNANRIKIYNGSGVFVAQLGETWTAGTDNAHFNSPKGVAIDSAGNVYVADTLNHRVQIFNSSRNYVATMGVAGVSGADNAHFNEPEGVTFDSGGNIYVADFQNHRIQKFNSSRVYIATLGESGVSGSDNAHFNLPNTVATDASGNFYVADLQNQRIQRFTSGLVYSDTLGVTGEEGNDNAHFRYPTGVAVNQTTDEIFVADSGNSRVQVFNSAFVYQRTIGVTGVPYLTDNVHFNKPFGIAIAGDGSIYVVENAGYRLLKLNSSGVPQWTIGQPGVRGSDNAHFGSDWAGLEGNPAIDAAGRVYVSDTGNNRIQVFNSNGTFYQSFGSGGNGNNQFECPTGVAISPVNGDIHVVDRCNQRVQVFTSNWAHKATLGVLDEIGTDNSHFQWPWGVAVDVSGNVFIADGMNHRVQKCVISGSTGICTTFAGRTGIPGEAFDQFGNVTSVFTDGSGRVYVADEWNSRVEIFDSNGAYLTTIGGAWSINTGGLAGPSGVAVDSAGNVYVTDRDNHRIQKFSPGVPGWRQVNINGFGNRYNRSATALEVFNGQLYAGASNWEEGGSVWRTSTGNAWSQVSQPGFGSAYTNTNPAIIDLTVFNGQLYAGVGWSGAPAQIWRSSDGTTWTQVDGNGFGDSANIGINTFAVYSNTLYAATGNDTNGVQIWRSSTGDSGSWSRVVNNGFDGDINNRQVAGMTVFGGYLYAAVGNQTTGSEVWRTGNGTTWNQVNTNGFGDSNNTEIGGWATFNGYLYVGSGNSTTGGQLWRSNNGTTWTQVIGNGLGDINNAGMESVMTFDGYLYTIARNSVTGVEVWRSSDGTSWQQVSTDGFGDSNNNASLWSNASTVFNNSLYIGTWNWNGNGGEIWQLLKQVYLPLIRR